MTRARVDKLPGLEIHDSVQGRDKMARDLIKKGPIERCEQYGRIVRHTGELAEIAFDH